jgi:NAD(P)-dependent dehydrogenase (short-subunit alcohol dehydrogenase family)
MARVFITGSSDGLGLLAGRQLARAGHEVVLHARNARRAGDTRAAPPGAAAIVVGDLVSLEGTREVARQTNAAGPFDAVIHNAAVGYRERPSTTPDGLNHVFAINVLGPYLLTALIARPKRLVYLSSGLHRSGDPSLDDLQWERRPWSGMQAYTDSKLHDVILAFAAARRWPDVLSNALEPGWVATKMGGPGAPDDLEAGAATQAWLASADHAEATVTGGYFYHQRLREAHPAARDPRVQDRLLEICAKLSGTAWP